MSTGWPTIGRDAGVEDYIQQASTMSGKKTSISKEEGYLEITKLRDEAKREGR